MDLEELKNKRRYIKSRFIRLVNALSRAVLNEEEIQVSDLLRDINKAFKEFGKVHDSFHEKFDNETDKQESEDYFNDIDSRYVEVLREVKIRENNIGKKDSNLALAQVLSLPRVDIEIFDGDPMRYHSFMSLFDECVDKVTDDNQTKLTHLLQFTTGYAKDSIRSCVMLGGKDGYTEARRTRKARFENDHLVASRLITELRRGPLVRSQADLQKLSD